MAKKITQTDLKIRDTVSIIDYYNKFVVPQSNKFYKLSEGRKAGLCPFHDETDASFHFWSETKMYHCFGCQRSGDIIKMHQEFVWKYEGRAISRQESIKELIALYGLNLTVEDDNIDEDGLTVFQRALKSVSDKSLYTIDNKQFSFAKFKQLNNMLCNINAPLDAKVENFGDLDRQAAIYLLKKKNM